MTIDDEFKNEIFQKYCHIQEIVYSERLRTLFDECQHYLNLYESLCTQVLGFSKPFLSNKLQIAEAIYYNTLSDYEKKRTNIAYYRGNCSAFSILFKDIIDRFQGFRDETIQESESRKLRGLISKHIGDSLLLINHYQASIGKDQLFNIYLTNNPDFSLYYDTCEQIIFGEANFDDPSDQSEVTPALIRVMIELRLKWSIGISGYIVNQSPGTMSIFIEVYNSFVDEKKVIVDLRFDIVKRIYGWANIYIHTGTRSYSWLTGFAVIILKPFFYGQSHRLSGVRVASLATIYEFWDALKHYFNPSPDKEVDVKILPYKPGFICTDKNYSPIPCRNHYAIYEDVMSKAGSNKAIAEYNEMYYRGGNSNNWQCTS